MDTKRGQALMELAVGMFALALVASALCVFAVYIAHSLRAQNELRAGGAGFNAKGDSVVVDDFAAAHFVGSGTMEIHEKVKLPAREMPR